MPYIDVHVEPWVRPYCKKILIKALFRTVLWQKFASKQLLKKDLDTAFHETAMTRIECDITERALQPSHL